MKFLKNRNTGVVFIWTEFLSKNDDMVPYEAPAAQPAPAPEPVAEVAAEPTAAEMAKAVLKKGAK
jgi:hypothetical protein